MKEIKLEERLEASEVKIIEEVVQTLGNSLIPVSESYLVQMVKVRLPNSKDEEIQKKIKSLLKNRDIEYDPKKGVYTWKNKEEQQKHEEDSYVSRNSLVGRLLGLVSSESYSPA